MSAGKIDLIRARAMLEVLGKPKEHVEKTIKMLVAKVKEDPDITIINEKYASIKPQEKTMFSTYVELEMVTKGLNTLIGFCFDFMPSSIDIEKPERLTLKNREISDMFNDLQAKLHDVDMIAKTLRVERDFLKRNLNMTITNSITILIKLNKGTAEQLAKFTGINKDELGDHLEKLIKQGKLKKDGDKYQVVSK